MQNGGGKTALGLDANIGALLCYVNICLPIGIVYSIIVLVTDKSNKLPRFHAFQSLLLLAVGIVLSIAINIVSAVAIAADVAILSMLIGLLGLVVGLGVFIAVVFCAFKAFKGEVFKLPVIGNLADGWSN